MALTIGRLCLPFTLIKDYQLDWMRLVGNGRPTEQHARAVYEWQELGVEGDEEQRRLGGPEQPPQRRPSVAPDILRLASVEHTM